jgi:hypothetical protein
MHYIEFLIARFPWASDADILLALDGWDQGTREFLHTEGGDDMREAETNEVADERIEGGRRA